MDNPGWDSSAQKLPASTDIRDLQRQLKAQGVGFMCSQSHGVSVPVWRSTR